MSPLLKNRSDVQSRLIRKYCILSGLLAFGIMMFTYLCHSNTLMFGDSTVLRMDLYHQYGPLYSELYDRIVNGQSLIYSWTSGLGGGFLGNLFNYCASPFALVILILGHINMPEAIAIMILLKAVFASVSFTYYINKSKGSAEIESAAFGLLYAFCGYFVAYSWNIMWLDAMAVFPLVILGIEKIIKDRKPGLYIFALTYTMITNYYMAYMVCIISVIYFLYFYFGRYMLADTIKPVVCENSEKTETTETTETANEADGAEKNKAKSKKEKKFTLKVLRNSRFFVSGVEFAAASVLCFLLSAFALLPVVYALKSSSATSSTFPDTLKVYFNFFDFIANHLPAVNTTIRSSGDIVLPNVYCGILTLFAVPFYFMSSRISGRRKIAAAVIIGIFYLSFSINYLNYIWHGMHFPNDLPYRFSFAYSFILLTLVYDVVLNRDEFSKKEYTVAGIALFAFVIFVDKLGSLNVEDKTIYLSLIFTIIYVVVFGLSKSQKYPKKTISTLLSFMIVVEICFCNTGNYIMSQSKLNYTSDYNSYQEISETVESSDDELFYRTELSKLRARMDPCWFGYNGVSTFSSMAYENTASLMKSLGLFGNDINSYTYNPQTPVFNSFFALKYIYDNSDLISESKYYSSVASNDDYDAYKYNYSLPIAFSVDKSITEWDTGYENPFTVQNDLVEKSTGVTDVLETAVVTNAEVTNLEYIDPVTVNSGNSFYFEKINSSEEATVKLTIDVEVAGDYYVYAGSTKLSRLSITAYDFSYDYLSSSIQPLTMDVGYQQAGAQITVEMTVEEDSESGYITFCAVKVNDENFVKAYDTICSNGLFEVTEFNESSFSGTINVTNDNAFMYTSIPYDESWQISVDGVTLSYYDENSDEEQSGAIVAVGGGLIGFELSTGEHEITFVYEPMGLSTGIKLTIIGIVILILLIIFSIVRKKRQKAEAEKEKLAEDFKDSLLTEIHDTDIANWSDFSENSPPKEQETEKAENPEPELPTQPDQADEIREPGEF